MAESFIDVQEEMELIKTRQQELLVEGKYGHEREVWRLQIVWEYLKAVSYTHLTLPTKA